MVGKILRISLEKGWIITIIYQGGDGSVTKRNIRVLAIDGDKIKAYCYLRGQMRVFDMKNILAADYCREKRTA